VKRGRTKGKKKDKQWKETRFFREELEGMERVKKKY